VKNATLSLALRNARLQLIVDAAAGGFLDIYTGAQPASPDDAAVSQVRLASVQLENPAFTGVVDAQVSPVGRRPRYAAPRRHARRGS
jgi:hypothetical protein